MPMNRDGQNRMDGFLHAAGNLDSARPDVQLYRERYRGTFSRPGLSGSSFDGAGLFVLLGFAGAIWLVFAVIHVVSTYWPVVVTIGVVLVLLAVSFIVNSWLPGYKRASLMLLTMLVASVVLWIAGVTIYNVYFARVRWPSVAAYLLADSGPPREVLMLWGGYAVAVYVVSLSSWVRQSLTPVKAILLANAILFAPLAAIILAALLVSGVQKLI